MSNRRLPQLLVVMSVLALLPFVVAAEIQLAASEDIVFERDILPILNSHCLQCHGGVHQRGELDLRLRSSALKGGKSGEVIVAGNPDASLLWQKVSKDEMPKTDNKVSAGNKEKIRRWIEAGAKGLERKSAAREARAIREPRDVGKLVDRLIEDKLARVAKETGQKKVAVSPLVGDGEFLRRVSLDITGRPPTAEVAAAFLAGKDSRKRERAVERLLASPEFGLHYAERWVNIFYLTTVAQRPRDPNDFIYWMAQELNAGQAWNDIVRDILTAYGPLSEAPQGAFFYLNGDMNSQFSAKILAGNIGQTLLGIQLQCAECHDHPFNDWKQTDFWSVAAFFGNAMKMETVENKNTPGVEERHMRIRKGKPETPPKNISISIPNDGEARNGGTKVVAKFLDGSEVQTDPSRSHRLPFADWLTSVDNRQFAVAAVNRLWAHLFARGLVNPLNDFGDHNAPTHSELLDTLTDEFVASNFDLRHMVRCLTASNAYQRSGRAVDGNDAAEAELLFVRMMPKVLTPEQLYDALCVALEVSDLSPPIDPKNPPKKPNPKAPPPPPVRTTFTAFFRGPGEADEPTEMKLGVPHALRLMNQANFNLGGQLVDRLVAAEKSPTETVAEIFVALLSRRPTADEATRFGKFVAQQPDTAAAYRRVVWVLLNSSEFLLNN